MSEGWDPFGGGGFLELGRRVAIPTRLILPPYVLCIESLEYIQLLSADRLEL